MSSEGVVQVAPDATGKRIRNLSLQILQPDGTLQTVYMQVVSIVDDRGFPIDFIDQVWQSEVLAELSAIRIGIEHISGVAFLKEGA
mgnify:CR=1 FL=1